MSKVSQLLHGLGNVISKAEAQAGPEVAGDLKQIGGAFHTVADLIEQKEAITYLGPVFGVLASNILNAATDSLANDLNPPTPIVGQ